MGLEADVALDRVGPLGTPGLDCLLPLAAELFLDCVAHQARLMHRFTFRFDTEPGLTLRRVANILHFARPAIAAILERRVCKANEIRSRVWRVRLSESEALNHTPSLADFTITTPALEFSVYTR